MGNARSKPLATWHERGTAWERHGMCELAFKVANIFMFSTKHKTILALILLKPHAYGVYVLI
jgi:hypothetical protein